MRTNGTISFLTTSTPATAADTDGFLLHDNPKWSSSVPCAVATLNDDRDQQGQASQVRQAHFTATLEGLACSPRAARVRLTRCGETLGEFQIREIRPLQTQGRTLVVV